MTTSKFFVSTLIAAAAMTATAYADTVIDGTSEAISSDTTYDGQLSLKNGGSVTQTAGTVTVGRLLIHTSNNAQSETYTLSGGILNVTGGDSSATGTSVAENQSAVIVGHWGNNGGLSTLSIASGAVLNVTSGWTTLSWDTSSKVDIEGEANLHGISFSGGQWYSPTATLALKSGGRLNLGAGGFVNETRTRGTVNINLEGGTLGALDSWSAGVAMNVSGAVVIDTTKRVGSSTAASTAGTEGATIALSGNISGAGALTVEGLGALALSGVVNVAGGISNAGTLDLSGADVTISSAITNTGTVTVSSDTTFALASSNANSGVYSIIANSGSGSITGWNDTTLNRSNFTVDGEVLNSRSTIDLSTAGVVTITGGAISLNWVGTDGTGTWNTASTNTPWADSESNAQFFANGDSVTFNSSDASVTVDGTVKPNAMTVSADTTFSGSGEIILAAPGNLTIDSGAKLSLGSGVTLDLGSSAGALDLSLVVGAGTVKYTHTKGDGGSSGLVTAADFTGLVDYVGNLNWSDSYNAGQVTIGNNGMTLRLSARSGEVDGIWGRSDKTFTNAIEFGSDYKIYLGSANLTLAGAVAAKGKALTLEGANTLKISGNATIGKLLGGTTNVTDGGVLTIGDEIENGDTSLISGTVNVLGGGTLKLAGHDALGYSNRGASGTVIAQGDSSDKTATILFADTGKLTLSKEIQLKGNTVVKNADGNTNAIKAFGGQFTATGTNNTISTAFDMSQGKVDFSVDQGGELTVDGVISGGNSWEKLGDGALTLKGANISYSGTINVSAGTLVAAHVSALGNGQVSVAADAKLGIVAGTTVTGVTGGIVLSDGAKLVIDLSSMVGETETFTLDLITGTTITFGETSLASNSSNVADTWYELSGWDKDGWASTLNYDSASQTLSLTMTIPEPSAFGLLAGVGALALVVSRRKRRK